MRMNDRYLNVLFFLLFVFSLDCLLTIEINFWLNFRDLLLDIIMPYNVNVGK